MAKILIWDIEASNLNADFGFVFCIGWKWVGEKKTHLIKLRDSKTFNKDCTNDKEVVEKFGEVMEQADYHVAHYGTFFDPQYVNTRRMIHELPPMAPATLVDTWKTARKKLKLHSNRLDSIFTALGVEAVKTRLDPKYWVRAAAGHIPSLRYIEEHCVKDVDALEKVYLKLQPILMDTPNNAGINGKMLSCPRCGMESVNGILQKRGLCYSKNGVAQRYQCKGCGGWCTGKREQFDVKGRT